MAGGTKRLPRAVREQQMLDAAVQVFSVHRYHETSMDVIATEAQISKPMLYLYYGSKEVVRRVPGPPGTGRFIEAVGADIDIKQAPRTCCAARSCRCCAHRRQSGVLDRAVHAGHQFPGLRAHRPGGREKIIDMVARLLGWRNPKSQAGHRLP